MKLRFIKISYCFALDEGTKPLNFGTIHEDKKLLHKLIPQAEDQFYLDVKSNFPNLKASDLAKNLAFDFQREGYVTVYTEIESC